MIRERDSLYHSVYYMYGVSLKPFIVTNARKSTNIKTTSCIFKLLDDLIKQISSISGGQVWF